MADEITPLLDDLSSSFCDIQKDYEISQSLDVTEDDRIAEKLESIKDDKRGLCIRFSMKLAAKICVMIEDKMTISGICRTKGMPSRRSLHRWRHQHPKFNEMMIVSEQIRLTHFVDEMMDMTSQDADVVDQLTHKYFREPSQKEIAAENIRIRLRVDVIKFLSAKLYADRSNSNVTQVDKVINVVNYSSIKTDSSAKVNIIPDLQPAYLKDAAMLTPAQQAQVDFVTKR